MVKKAMQGTLTSKSPAAYLYITVEITADTPDCQRHTRYNHRKDTNLTYKKPKLNNKEVKRRGITSEVRLFCKMPIRN